MSAGDGAAVDSLRDLRDRPFELLRELERRSRAKTVGIASDAPPGREWVGVAFRIGGETFLIAREETREVLGYPPSVTRIPGAKPWIKGLANVRGQLLPLIDLRQFLGSGLTAVGRNTRGPRRRRGARVPALRGRRIQRRSAADGDSLRQLSRGCVSARRRALAGDEREGYRGKPELPAGGELDSGGAR